MGRGSLEKKYVPPVFTQETGSTGFPEIFKTDSSEPSRFRRKEFRKVEKKQRSVFASKILFAVTFDVMVMVRLVWSFVQCASCLRFFVPRERSSRHYYFVRIKLESRVVSSCVKQS